MSKYGKNISHTSLFLPRFDIICALSECRRTTKRNLLVKMLSAKIVLQICNSVSNMSENPPIMLKLPLPYLPNLQLQLENDKSCINEVGKNCSCKRALKVPIVYCIRHRKNALLIAFGVQIIWDNQRILIEWILGRISGNPRRFCRGG